MDPGQPKADPLGPITIMDVAASDRAAGVAIEVRRAGQPERSGRRGRRRRPAPTRTLATLRRPAPQRGGRRAVIASADLLPSTPGIFAGHKRLQLRAINAANGRVASMLTPTEPACRLRLIPVGGSRGHRPDPMASANFVILLTAFTSFRCTTTSTILTGMPEAPLAR